jgi:Tfp pilus assembly protein PilO
MVTRQEEETGWHLDKRVPVTIILVLLMQGVAGLWVVAEMRKDIDVLKVQMAEQKERDRRQDEQVLYNYAQLREDLKHLLAKVDELSSYLRRGNGGR